MRFLSPLIPATLLRRYKRFLADVVLADGEETTVHVANPGAMTGLAAPGTKVWLSKSDNPARKLTYSWELAEVDFGSGMEFVGVNTGHPNALVAAAIAAGAIRELSGYGSLRRGGEKGPQLRIRFFPGQKGEPARFVEGKKHHPNAGRGVWGVP